MDQLWFNNILNNMTTKITLNNIADTALATLTGPKVTTIVYPGTETATDVVGGATINLTGGGFQSGCSVLVASTASSVVTFISATQISFIAPALSAGTYVIYVINPDGGTAISIPGVSYSGTPNWTTTAGTLGDAYETGAISATLTATGDAPITYTLASGTLPTGSTLASNGTLSGPAQATASATTYSFTVTARDAQNQTTNRSFSLTINPDVVTWVTPTASATYNVEKDTVMANVIMSATSAAGGSITYTADTLPTGLSITGANIAGTPTVTANTSTTLTATATSTRAATRTINWVVSVASDTYFKNTTLLLSGNGTNNQTNNTFLDGSTNNFTITRNGNTTQGTFSPYGPNWSNYFDGNADFLQLSNNNAFLFGSGDFTLECWFFSNSITAEHQVLMSIWDDASTVPQAWDWRIYNSGKIWFQIDVASSDTTIFTSTATLSAGQWYHLAITRSGNTFRLFINGTLDSTTTNSSTISNGNGPLCIGGYTGSGQADKESVNGYLSNVRIVKGTAVYTSAFTPSTTPLTAISGTSLLTCQSNRFIDNSTNAFAITTSGSPSVQRFSPFSPGATYSTSTIGGSGYFDGTGDYLSAPSNAAFNVSSNNVTAEAWVYLIAFNTGGNPFISTIWSLDSSGSQNTFAYIYNTGAIAVGINGVNEIASSAGVIKLGAWYHTAVVRNGSTTTVYVNGVSVASNTTSVWANTGARPFLVGSTTQSANYYLNGYISNMRFVNGTAVYTSAFTPPTAPVTAITNTSILLNYTNAGIIDNTMLNNLETVGNAQISTAQTKFGSGSMYFDGNGDNLYSPTSINYNCGTGNFTVEAWVYISSYPGSYPQIIGNNNGSWSAGALSLTAQNSTSGGPNKISLSAYDVNSGTATLSSSSTNSFNTWYHVALVRNGTSLSLYRDGTSVASTTISTGIVFDWGKNGILIGGGNWDGANGYFNGYIDDLRITKGYVRYTTALATTSNTTASSIRSGSSLAGFFGSYGVFNTTASGQYLLVDFGVSVSNIQTTYLNYNGGQWAPTSVLIQTSDDNSTWSTVVTYSDNNTNTLQTIASTGSGRYWRIYQNSATRQNSAGYEWHLGNFSMTNSFTPPTSAFNGR